MLLESLLAVFKCPSFFRVPWQAAPRFALKFRTLHLANEYLIVCESKVSLPLYCLQKSAWESVNNQIKRGNMKKPISSEDHVEARWEVWDHAPALILKINLTPCYVCPRAPVFSFPLPLILLSPFLYFPSLFKNFLPPSTSDLIPPLNNAKHKTKTPGNSVSVI